MNEVGSAVHFGAGALGRGLVVPRLVEAGWSVTLVEPLPDLVQALQARNGYALEISDGLRRDSAWIEVAAAMHPEIDRAAVAKALADASLITTAVRKENLGTVAAQLADAWRHDSPSERSIIACENVAKVDQVVLQALSDAGMSDRTMVQLNVPRTAVDRICASDWPTYTSIQTEPYAQLAAAKSATVIPGVEQVDDIDALFDRKRYLVNTLADAAAILGRARGYQLLSEAIQDQEIVADLTPLIDALIHHLVLRYGFATKDLAVYGVTSVRRLANASIPRRLDTVARDIWRKLQPDERFLAPLIDLQRRGLADQAALAIVGRLASLGAALDRADGRKSFTPADLAGAGESEDPAVRSIYDDIAKLMAAAP